MRALSAADLRPCMNPQSILWPAWPEDQSVTAQQTARSRKWAKDQPVVILNSFRERDQ